MSFAFSLPSPGPLAPGARTAPPRPGRFNRESRAGLQKSYRPCPPTFTPWEPMAFYGPTISSILCRTPIPSNSCRTFFIQGTGKVYLLSRQTGTMCSFPIKIPEDYVAVIAPRRRRRSLRGGLAPGGRMEACPWTASESCFEAIYPALFQTRVRGPVFAFTKTS